MTRELAPLRFSPSGVRPNSRVPNDERIVEQSATLQIFQQRGDRLIGHQAVVLQLRIERTVMVPRRMEDADDANAALDQAPRQQAVPRERAEQADAAEVRS